MTKLHTKIIFVAVVGFLTSAVLSNLLIGHSMDRVRAAQTLLAEICHPFVANADKSVFDRLQPLGISGHLGDQKSRLQLVTTITNDRRECSIDDAIDPLTETDRDRWVEIARSDPSGFLNGNGKDIPVDDLGWDVFEIQDGTLNGRQRYLKIVRFGSAHDDFTTTVTLTDAPVVTS